MRRVIIPPSLAISRWTRSISGFALLLILTTFVLHRIFGMPTLVALNLALLAYVIAAAGLVLGLFGAFIIWRTGAEGTGNVALGVMLSLAILLAPPLVLQAASNTPQLNDVTTDFSRPPPFQSVTALRGAGANPVTYRRDEFAEQQQEHYPDIKPLMINRPATETFALVVDALKRENLDVVRQDPPSDDGGAPGFIEATDRTLVFGFYDDVAVRIQPFDGGARVDMRSASRFGRHDLGRNAERLRTLMRQVVVRLEETVPAIASEAGKTGKPDEAKQEESARRARVSARRARARARARAQRARERRAPRRQRPMEVPRYISPMPGY